MAVSRIQDYAIIGDSRSAALVSRSGSIDWLCWPRFESPSLFAAILDPAVGGHWKIAPAARSRVTRHCIEDSNILVTEFETLDGVARLVDLMPVFSEEDKKHILVPEHEILRIIECSRGDVEIEAGFEPRPDYGRHSPRLRVARGLGIRVEDGEHLYGFERPGDSRLRATFRKLRERLEAAPGLLYRYEESRAAGEGAFGICSFWAAEYLARDEHPVPARDDLHREP